MWTSRTESLIEGHYFNKCVCAESIILTGLKTLAPWKESYDKPRQWIKKQRHHFANKSPYSQSYGFSSNHVLMWWGVRGIVTTLCPTLATPWTVACQAHLFMGFPRQEYWSGFPFPSPGNWIMKKAEHWRIDAFELLHWRRLLRVSWTARRSNQYILKEISPRCSLEGLMLKLKFQYFGHLMGRADSFEKTLMLGKIEGRSTRG